MPNKSRGSSLRKFDLSKAAKGAKLPDSLFEASSSWLTPRPLASVLSLSGFGYFLPFSISLRYDPESPVILASSEKE